MNFVISCDIKLTNILCRLQSYASTHPCTWCKIDSKNLSCCGFLRKIGSLLKWNGTGGGFCRKNFAIQKCSFCITSNISSIEKTPLGLYSEQGTESAHNYFNSHWQRFNRRIGHPEYDKRLRNWTFKELICRINSYSAISCLFTTNRKII